MNFVETFFREVSGTFINCLAAGIFAKMISKAITPHVMPEVKLSADTWYSYDSLNTLKSAWDKSGNVEDYTKTVFVFVHRLSTIHNADRIAVLNEGVMVELGTHNELINIPDGRYKYLYDMQFASKV